MEDSEVVDDQNTGWFQVKKNPVPVSVSSSISVSNEEESTNYLNTSVVGDNSENQKSAPLLTTESQGKLEEARKLDQTDKPDTAQKTRWGDLEEGGLVLPHENSIGVGIKFGSIGDDSLLICRKHENIPDPCDSYHAQEKGLTATTIDVEVESHQNPSLRREDEIFGENGKDVKNMSVEHLKNQEMNGAKIGPEDDLLYCDKKNDEINKTATDSGVNNDFLSTKMLRWLEINHIALSMCLSKAVTAQGAESQVPEIVRDSVVSVEEVRGPKDGNVESVVSSSHNMSAPEEGDSSESKERFRQRLWCFLFENLNRSVDELYLLCELECDLEQMKEAILVLEEAASDFKELITRVEEFEKVKKSSQIIDGVPVILKSDHRRPHALSWEVRRMTTHRIGHDILSSSLEAFRKIQQERASLQSNNNAGKCLTSESVGNMKKSRVSDGTHNTKDSVTRSRKHTGSADANPGNLNEKKHNTEVGGNPVMQSQCKMDVTHRKAY
ncbi:S phase cyclin A-associated protein in the endoplasmic reticulum, N-terminal [Sesbania bispinosa]|nr:S phase cyclin A-associated protein in the endoplasmic reticulum, N-terminal [Sesbania bispinosa]